ncbi:kinase [Hirsutella rhossiliensis]
MQRQIYRCDIQAEPLHRYQQGGYHPLTWIRPRSAGRPVSNCPQARLGRLFHYVGCKRQKRRPIRLDYLASNDIGHGAIDLHTRNLAIMIPDLSSSDEASFFDKLGEPEISLVSRLDGRPLSDNVPTYVVRPTLFLNKNILLSSRSVKIIDFGEAFFNNNIPRTLHIPLPVRVPEVVFGDLLDRRVDLWSAACMLFELVTGQPPFDVIMLTPPILVQQMMEFATDELPSRWQAKWQAMQKYVPRGDDSCTLQQWLEEVYFDDNEHPDFSREDIVRVGGLIKRMLKFEPSLRDTARDALADPWFDRG